MSASMSGPLPITSPLMFCPIKSDQRRSRWYTSALPCLVSDHPPPSLTVAGATGTTALLLSCSSPDVGDVAEVVLRALGEAATAMARARPHHCDTHCAAVSARGARPRYRTGRHPSDGLQNMVSAQCDCLSHCWLCLSHSHTRPLRTHLLLAVTHLPLPFTCVPSPIVPVCRNTFRCNMTETLIRNIASAMVDSGLSKARYEYINQDDCWALPQRDNANLTQADSAKFPSGMTALSSFIHSLGLKFGMYSDAGYQMCIVQAPGSYGFEDIDARTFAGWGADYHKYDDCSAAGLPYIPRYTAMRDAIAKTGRPILYSMSHPSLSPNTPHLPCAPSADVPFAVCGCSAALRATTGGSRCGVG